MEKVSMFFVTTLYVDKNGELCTSRCVGYFETYEEAKDVVLNNILDIFERLYNYAVIEEVSPGLYELDLNPHWFKISDDYDSYHEIEKPKFAEHIVGFGIG